MSIHLLKVNLPLCTFAIWDQSVSDWLNVHGDKNCFVDGYGAWYTLMTKKARRQIDVTGRINTTLQIDKGFCQKKNKNSQVRLSWIMYRAKIEVEDGILEVWKY